MNISDRKLWRGAPHGNLAAKDGFTMPSRPQTDTPGYESQEHVRILREVTKLRSHALRTRILALDVTCDIAETHLRFDQPDRARLSLARVIKGLAVIEAFLHNPEYASAGEPGQLRQYLEAIRPKIERLKALVEEYGATPSALPLPSEFSNCINALCTRAGINIYDLSHRLGMLPSELLYAINGRVKPTTALVQDLARELDGDVCHLEKLAAEIKTV